MNDKEFRKLHRKDLIEIIYQYQCREQELCQQNEALRKELHKHRTQIQNAGSIAEAALALNDVFSAAQKAADHYLMEIESMHKELAEKISENREANSPAGITLTEESDLPLQTTGCSLQR